MAPLFETLFTTTRLPLSPHSATKNDAISTNPHDHHDSPSLLMTPRVNNNNSNKPKQIQRFNFNSMASRAEDERDEKLTSISRHLRELSKDSFINDDISGTITTPTRAGLSPRRTKNQSSSTPTSPKSYIEIHNSNSNSSNGHKNALMEGMNLIHHLMILELQNHGSLQEEKEPIRPKPTAVPGKQSIQQNLDKFLQNHPMLSHPSTYSDDKDFNFSSFYKTCTTLLSTLQTLSTQNYLLNQQYSKYQEQRQETSVSNSEEINKLISKNYQLQQENELLHEKVESYRQKRIHDQLNSEEKIQELRIEMRRLYEERMYALMVFHEGVLQGELIQRSQERSDDKEKKNETKSHLFTPGMSSLLWLVENEYTKEKEDDENDDNCPTTGRGKDKDVTDQPSLSVPSQKSSSPLIKTSDATVKLSYEDVIQSTNHQKPKKAALQLADAMVTDDERPLHGQGETKNKNELDKDMPANEEMSTQDSKEDNIVIIVPKTKSTGIKLLCLPDNDNDPTNNESKHMILAYAITKNFDESINEISPPIGSKLISLNSTPFETLCVESVKQLKQKIESLQKEGDEVTLTFCPINVERELNNEQRKMLEDACNKAESKQRKQEEEEKNQEPKGIIAALTPLKKKSSSSLEQKISDDKDKENIENENSQKKKSKPSSWLGSSKHSSWLSPAPPLTRSSSASSPAKRLPKTLVCDDDKSCSSSLSSSSSLKSLSKGATSSMQGGAIISLLPPCEIEEDKVLLST